VAATGKPLAIADTRGDPRVHFPQHIEPYGVVSYLGLPVKFQDRLFGVLVFNTPTPRAYSEAEITFLTAFAGQAALALQNAELFREEQDRRRQLETVRTVSEELTRELDLRTLLSLITRRATELVGAERGTIFLWDERAGLLIPEAWHGYGEWRGEMRLRLGEGLAGTVAERREGMIVNDYRHWPHAIAMTLERAPITSAIAEPLLYQGRLLGVIALSRQGVEHPFAENDRQRLGLFTSHAAIAMENARLYREVQEHAEALERRVEERTRALKETQVELVQSAKLAAVGTLAAGVAHELNQPLTVIRGYAQGLLAEDSLDAEVKTDLDRIQAQTIRMAKIINHLRDFSRQSRGILEPVVLNEVIEAAFTLVSQQLHLRNIKVVTELDPALPMVRGDRVQLEQVFLNLITNARDAMQPQGGGRLTVTTRRVDWSTGQLVDSSRPIDQSTARPLDASAGWLEAAVADTGPGVPEAIQDRIFDPFFTTKEVGQGTGLGLSISYGIVREHGGEIRAENRPEGGAVFVVRLPLAARQEPGMEHLESGGEP
jgi:signal transduction histidine kinase